MPGAISAVRRIAGVLLSEGEDDRRFLFAPVLEREPDGGLATDLGRLELHPAATGDGQAHAWRDRDDDVALALSLDRAFEVSGEFPRYASSLRAIVQPLEEDDGAAVLEDQLVGVRSVGSFVEGHGEHLRSPAH